jgi:DNA repair exonuclease SbcCD nuclease subunit
MILFTADWHIKLGQKNVPVEWAKNRYRMFFDELFEIERTSNIHLHIVGGDLFDRIPTIEELELYFEWVHGVTVPTIVFDGNHEATRKNKTFLTNLKDVTKQLNPKVQIVDKIQFSSYGILPYCELYLMDQFLLMFVAKFLHT